MKYITSTTVQPSVDFGFSQSVEMVEERRRCRICQSLDQILLCLLPVAESYNKDP